MSISKKRFTGYLTGVLSAALCLLALSLAACSSGGNAETKHVTVGAKQFAENQIVAKVIQLALEDNGFKVDYVDNLEGDVLQSAIETGEIDLYPEYTNTGLTRILKLDPIFDPDEAYKVAKEQYKEVYNIAWLEPSAVNNTYCLVANKDTADRLGIKTVSDLQANAGEIRAAQGWDWSDRPDLLPAMENAYGPFAFKDATLYSGQLVYEILINDEGDVTLGYTTDPQLENEKLVALEDDKNIWPPYHLVPIVKQETLDKYPEIEEIINNISKKLDTETVIELNADVVIRHEEVPDVAKSFYDAQVK